MRTSTSADRSIRSALAIVSLAMTVAITTGCSLPAHFRVRSGTDPAHVDKDVQFRTTYYFRVFDFCESLQAGNAGGAPPGESSRHIVSDSLYRFRMTGKASSLTNKVRFESGTLRAGDIDPFGADVEFDAKSGRFRYRSKGRTQEEATVDQVRRDVATLIEVERETLAAQTTDAKRVSALSARISNLIDQRLDRLELQSNGASKPGQPATPAHEAKPAACKEPLRRGFQIFGPEGWRTFDQDERLLIAMSSSGQPLIDTMRELSARVLQQGQAGSPSASALLDELVRVRDAQAILPTTDAQQSPSREDVLRQLADIDERLGREAP